MNLKNGKVFTNKFVGTGPSSYEKIIYRAAVSQRLRNTDLESVLGDRITSRRILPPRSPYLKAHGCCLWGILKDEVLSDYPRTEDGMK